MAQVPGDGIFLSYPKTIIKFKERLSRIIEKRHSRNIQGPKQEEGRQIFQYVRTLAECASRKPRRIQDSLWRSSCHKRPRVSQNLIDLAQQVSLFSSGQWAIAPKLIRGELGLGSGGRDEEGGIITNLAWNART